MKTPHIIRRSIDLPYKGMKEAFEVVSNLDVEVWCVSSLGTPKPEWKCDRFFSQVPIDQMKNIYLKLRHFIKAQFCRRFFWPPNGDDGLWRNSSSRVVTDDANTSSWMEKTSVMEQANIDQAREAVQRLINDPKLRNKLIGQRLDDCERMEAGESIDSLEDHYPEA